MLATRRTISRLSRRDGVRQIALVLAAIGAYELARLAIEPNWPAAMANARRIADLERALALGFERQLQDAFLAIPDVVKALNLFYFVGHFVLTGVFFVWLYHRSRHGFRSFRDGFLVATAIAVIVHWQFPTAPPRLADVGLLDTLRTLSGIDIGSQASTALSNPVFAVPSLHAGYAAGVGLGLFAFGRRLVTRILGVVYPALVTLTIIVTGNHFVFDAIAGVLVMALGFLVAAAWRRRSDRREETPAAAIASR
ncbi:MAG: phosphatase PAP2 family protein [Actinomycetota bacterium]|nr:phosphatase PAP2 family protein [Actinomycetota bacterium]